MKISKLIIELQKIQEQYGNLECKNLYCDDISLRVDSTEYLNKNVLKFV
jgi:hypothetical protein